MEHAVVISGQPSTSNTLPPTGLLCEFLAAPQHAHIETPVPFFHWVMRDRGRDVLQTAYQIQVASTLENLLAEQADLWDSGRIETSSMGDDPVARYAGKALPGGQIAHWKVRTWNNSDQPSPYSSSQTFRMRESISERQTARAALGCEEIAAQEIVRLARGHYFVAFPRAAFGTLQFRLPQGAIADKVEVVLGERREGDRVWRHCGDDHPDGDQKIGGEHIVSYETTLDLDGKGENILDLPRVDSPAAATLPHGIQGILPFRYAEIRNCPFKLERSDLQQLAVVYPFDDDAAQFFSSDPVLNDVWEMCKYSIKATTALGVYVDGNRERLPYEADAYINQLGHYCCDREYGLGRFTHEHLVQHPTWPTEWNLHSVLMAWEDYFYTGNADSLDTHYSELQAKTLSALARPDGLISTETGLMDEAFLKSIHMRKVLKDITDWPPGERFNFEMRPVNTVVNAFHYRALVLMSRIARVLGHAQDATDYDEASEKVRASAMQNLFDAKRGLFRDGEGSEHVSLHANLFPLALGLVPEEKRGPLVDYVVSQGMACSVYAAHYLVEGLYRASADEAALSLLSSIEERSWSNMIYRVGSTISLEAWDPRFKPNLDWNHAWGAAPANLIPRWLMGVRPLEAGFRKILIAPRPASLRRARITVPTIRGTVSVAFDNVPDEHFRMNLEIPANTSARVGLPVSAIRDPMVLLDGVETDTQGASTTVWIDSLGSGKHTLELRSR